MSVLARLWAGEDGEAPGHLDRAARLLAKRDLPNGHLWMVDRNQQTVAWGRVSYFESMPAFPANCVPTGWYLMGINVLESHRRQGIAAALTLRRLTWLVERTNEVFTFIEPGNEPSEQLHAHAGFERVAEDVWFPGLTTGERVLDLWRWTPATESSGSL